MGCDVPLSKVSDDSDEKGEDSEWAGDGGKGMLLLLLRMALDDASEEPC